MKLSTTINFFTYEDDGSYSAYYYDLEHYAKLGFSHLDSIFARRTHLFHHFGPITTKTGRIKSGKRRTNWESPLYRHMYRFTISAIRKRA